MIFCSRFVFYFLFLLKYVLSQSKYSFRKYFYLNLTEKPNDHLDDEKSVKILIEYLTRILLTILVKWIKSKKIERKREIKIKWIEDDDQIKQKILYWYKRFHSYHLLHELGVLFYRTQPKSDYIQTIQHNFFLNTFYINILYEVNCFCNKKEKYDKKPDGKKEEAKGSTQEHFFRVYSEGCAMVLFCFSLHKYAYAYNTKSIRFCFYVQFYRFSDIVT